MGSKKEASTVGEDEGVARSGRCRRPTTSAPLTVPLERPPPCLAALEMVCHALLDGVGDNGGGQPQRRWLSDLGEQCQRRRRADIGTCMRIASGCGSGETLECGEQMGAKMAEVRRCGGGGRERTTDP